MHKQTRQPNVTIYLVLEGEKKKKEFETCLVVMDDFRPRMYTENLKLRLCQHILLQASYCTDLSISLRHQSPQT